MSKLRIVFIMFLSTAFVFSGCKKDNNDPEYSSPEVTAPSSVISIGSGADGTATFNVSVDSDLTATYTATGTGVTVTNGSGTVSGTTVPVNFTAGTTAGAASITLKVTDSEGQNSSATAVLNIDGEADLVVVTENIDEDATWTAGKTYILGGRIAVLEGVTLTIEAGTVIKGEAGTGANATALLVARGGTLLAEGEEDLPIIFTSIADEITPEDVAAGQFASPNLDSDYNGLWGGVIVLGNAPISASNDNDEDVTEVQIEGIPTSDPNGLYGGDDASDNSGILRYISIRHGGSNIGSGNEINGLTLGGVGNGTTIDNIEIVANQDDGIEWFGGAVNVSNVVVWNAGDDGIDTDQAWTGTLSNFVVITVGGHSFELDGPEGSAIGKHTIEKGSVIASDLDNEYYSEDLINVDDNSEVILKDIYITGIRLDPAQMINRVDAPEVSFENIILNVAAADLANHVNGAVPAGIIAGTTPQADITGFGWTWAALGDAFAGLE